MYSLEEISTYSLGDILPLVVVIGIAIGIAKFIAIFGVVTLKNANKWAIFCASVTGIAYAFHMFPDIKIENEFFRFIG